MKVSSILSTISIPLIRRTGNAIRSAVDGRRWRWPLQTRIGIPAESQQSAGRTGAVRQSVQRADNHQQQSTGKCLLFCSKGTIELVFMMQQSISHTHTARSARLSRLADGPDQTRLGTQSQQIGQRSQCAENLQVSWLQWFWAVWTCDETLIYYNGIHTSICESTQIP